MSTRSNTRIKEGNNVIILYKHHDGYPSGVGAYLTDILKKYGFDKFKENYLDLLNSEDACFSSFEEYDYYAGDSEYIYTVDIDNKTLSYIDKCPCDDNFDFSKIDEMESTVLYEENTDEYVNSIKEEIEFHVQKINELKEKLKNRNEKSN